MEYDAIVVGGGPAGSTCARFLTKAGLRVAVIDRAEFPRVKLCAGWLSEPVWDVLDLDPRDYPRGLWPWERCHVVYGGERHSVRVRGYFIRRYEFDDFLLRESGAELLLGRSVKKIERTAEGWVVDGELRARYLIGAGGTHCPVARALSARRPLPPVGVQEHEFQADPEEVARTRVGGDGEPELLLHDDLRGYSWNVPKTDWVNVGCGTVAAREVRSAWQRARTYFEDRAGLPTSAAAELERVKGHSYYLFHPEHLESAYRDDALLIGDSLGLAHPLTAEGIYPALLSARLAAEAIAAGAPERYPGRLERHPAIAGFELVFHARDLGAKVSRRRFARPAASPTTSPRLGRAALAHGFAHLFAGGKVPAAHLARLVARAANRATGGARQALAKS
jgi:menaquinone-9 beta-reductase